MTYRTLRTLFATAAVGLAFTVGLGGNAQAASLEDAVRMAVTTNPEVGVAVRERQAVVHDREQAEGGYYPSVDLSASYGPEYTDSPTTRNRGEDHTTMPRSSMTLSLTQMLFDGWATASSVERQEARLDSAGFRVREATEFVGLDAVETYLEVLRRQQLARLAQENLGVHEQYLSMVQRRFDGGRGDIADVRQAESRLGNARTTLTEAIGNLRDSEATFARVVGMPPMEMSFPSFPYDMFPQDIDHAVALSLINNPTVNIATAEVTVKDAEADQADSVFYPEFDLQLSGSHRRNNDGTRGNDKELLGLVSMNWNLYNGGSDTARSKAAVTRRARSRENLERIKREVEEQTRISWNAFVTAKQRANDLKTVVEANARVRDDYLSQFDIGKRTLLDLLDSENEYFISSGSLITAEFTTLLGAYRVLAQTGSLLQALNVAGPDTMMTADNGGGY